MSVSKTLLGLIRQHAGRVIVHLGSGAQIPGCVSGRKLGKNELHICVDLKEPQLEEANFAEKIQNRGKVGEHEFIGFSGNNRVVFVKSDMKNTPLPKECADRIHLENALANYEMANHGEAGTFSEVNRLLKPEGIAQNVETHPLISTAWINTFEQATKAGLKIEVVIPPLTKRASLEDADFFQRHLKRYNPREAGLILRGAYILKFRKE